jgi:hypothetical protein
MRQRLVFCIFIGTLATLLAAKVVDASDRRDRNRDVDNYAVRAERILEGIVTGKGHMIDGLMYFRLKTGDTIVEVQVGPKEFAQRNTFTFSPGDVVVVVGAPVVLNERSVVLAREISGMKGTLVLRDNRGLRYGTAIRSERIR